MTSAAEMAGLLRGFVDQFNRVPELPRMAAGWNRSILVQAADAGWVHGLRVEGGRVSLSAVTPATAQITLHGPADTLAAIFRGELSPTEPYLDGTLIVRSSEEDMLKLDVFTLMVWGE